MSSSRVDQAGAKMSAADFWSLACRGGLLAGSPGGGETRRVVCHDGLRLLVP